MNSKLSRINKSPGESLSGKKLKNYQNIFGENQIEMELSIDRKKWQVDVKDVFRLVPKTLTGREEQKT